MKSLNGILLICLLFPLMSEAQEESSYTDKEAFDLMKTIEGTPFRQTTNKEAQWFPEAGFGLFMHWGIYSVGALDASWPMIKNCPWANPCSYVEKEKYYNLANEFNPSAYDPEKWAMAAKLAGFQYMVLTAKHHDGYCLWPTKYGEMSTGKYMNGRDLLKPYVDACRKFGLKVGLYFSPRDWSNPVYPMVYADYDFKNEGKGKVYPDDINQQKFDEFFDNTVGQMSEILTRYGKIDILWFDGIDWPKVDTHSEKLHAWLRTIQPGIVINPRWNTNDNKKSFGDFRTEEISWAKNLQISPRRIRQGDWWEFCDIWAGSWGYNPFAKFKDIQDVIKILAYTRSYGGNYLLDLGPAPDGTMRPGFYSECIRLSEWMKYNKESVIGTQGVNNWPEISNAPLTKKGNCYYAHILKDNNDLINIKDKRRPLQVIILKSGKQLQYEYNKNTGITIQLEQTDREFLDDVIKVIY